MMFLDALYYESDDERRGCFHSIVSYNEPV